MKRPVWFVALIVLAACSVPCKTHADDFPLEPGEAQEYRDILQEETLLQLSQATDDVDRPERPEAAPKKAAPTAADAPSKALTPEELIHAIKLRAQREIARRRARRWALNTYTSWTVGSESNPLLQKSRSSALFSEEYLSATFSYKLLPKLTWQTGYSADFYTYNEFKDLDTISNSLTTKLLWYLSKPVRLEAHYTFDDVTYPEDEGSSTWDQKVHLRLRQAFRKNYYHYAGWTYLYKQYKHRTTRDGAGTRIPTKYRKDDRHTGIYEIGGTFGENTLLRFRQEAYWHDANDAFQDFYDAQDYKIRLSANHDWNRKWSTGATFGYELKRYERRDVAERGVAQQDYTKNYDLNVSYKLSYNVDVTYAWKYRRNDSNDPAYSYQDITNSLALSASF